VKSKSINVQYATKDSPLAPIWNIICCTATVMLEILNVIFARNYSRHLARSPIIRWSTKTKETSNVMNVKNRLKHTIIWSYIWLFTRLTKNMNAKSAKKSSKDRLAWNIIWSSHIPTRENLNVMSVMHLSRIDRILLNIRRNIVNRKMINGN
jgi:hypothetical protein